MNEPLAIDAGTIVGPWDGTPVDYGSIAGHLMVAEVPGDVACHQRSCRLRRTLGGQDKQAAFRWRRLWTACGSWPARIRG